MLDLSYLDGVVISSPHHAHYENAKAALEKNCHVMIEKPMTTVSREAETLLQLAKKKNKHINKQSICVFLCFNIIFFQQPLILQILNNNSF